MSYRDLINLTLFKVSQQVKDNEDNMTMWFDKDYYGLCLITLNKSENTTNEYYIDLNNGHLVCTKRDKDRNPISDKYLDTNGDWSDTPDC